LIETTTIQQHNNQPRTMALGGDIQAMFGSADSSFEFKHKRFRVAHAENNMSESWFEIQKRLFKAGNLLKSLWRGIKPTSMQVKMALPKKLTM
jgi:hypothetical protein